MAHAITLDPRRRHRPGGHRRGRPDPDRRGRSIDWDRHDAGVIAFKRFGQSLPTTLLDSVKRTKVALKGPVTTPIAEGFTSVNVGLRKALDLYANLRPVKNLPGVASRFTDVDLIIVRENTEDLYAGLEHEVVPGVVESLKIITEKASTRIARFAFEYARKAGRKKVTAIHKANIMKLSDGLFLNCARAVSHEYLDIAYDERIVDAACMHLVMHPEKFDVLRAAEPVRRHRVGPVRRPGRRARRRAGREHRRGCGGVRGGARQRAGHRRQEPGEPDGAAALGADDARAHRRARQRRSGSAPRSARVLAGRPDPHPRSRRHGVDHGVHRRGLPRDRAVTARRGRPVTLI